MMIFGLAPLHPSIHPSTSNMNNDGERSRQEGSPLHWIQLEPPMLVRPHIILERLALE